MTNRKSSTLRPIVIGPITIGREQEAALVPVAVPVVVDVDVAVVDSGNGRRF
ncbi:MAG: hypothetical protein ACKOX7_07835 [Bacteroidota bacterium]